SGSRRPSRRGWVTARHLHDVQPVGVARVAPVQGVVEGQLDRASDRPRLTGPDRAVVDLPDRNELRRGPRQKYLVGEVQLRARQVVLNQLVVEIGGDLDDRLAAD